MSVAAPYVLLNSVSSYSTLLHHTRDRKVERKFLDASGIPTLKWKRGGWISLEVLNTPDGQSQHWDPGAALPSTKPDTGVSSTQTHSYMYFTSTAPWLYSTIKHIG
eukprot:Em0007g1414a